MKKRIRELKGRGGGGDTANATSETTEGTEGQKTSNRWHSQEVVGCGWVGG